MGKALPFPQHKHPPSTLDPAFKLRIGALSNDQGTEAPNGDGGPPDGNGSTPELNDEETAPEATGAESVFGE